MTARESTGPAPEGGVDIGDYCRRVESHLTKVNGGHLVRIVGPAFDLVRRWAEDGVPLTVVFRGIDRKAERHGRGRIKRPLRIEFCEGDVRDLFENWRRAVGIVSPAMLPGQSLESDRAQDRRRPSLSRHLERAVDRLDRTSGRLDWPEPFRAGLQAVRDALVVLQGTARGARGPARDQVLEQLAALERRQLELARAWAPAEMQRDVRRDAESDLAGYRGRLPEEQWRTSIDVTAARLLRDRLGLPALDPAG